MDHEPPDLIRGHHSTLPTAPLHCTPHRQDDTKAHITAAATDEDEEVEAAACGYSFILSVCLSVSLTHTCISICKCVSECVEMSVCIYTYI